MQWAVGSKAPLSEDRRTWRALSSAKVVSSRVGSPPQLASLVPSAQVATCLRGWPSTNTCSTQVQRWHSALELAHSAPDSSRQLPLLLPNAGTVRLLAQFPAAAVHLVQTSLPRISAPGSPDRISGWLKAGMLLGPGNHHQLTGRESPAQKR